MVEQKENNESELSVIIPVHNEENNILSLTDEICKAFNFMVNSPARIKTTRISINE